MAYGLLIRNNANEVQIDNENPVLALLSSGYYPLYGGYQREDDYLDGNDITQVYLRETVASLPTNGAGNVVVFVSPARGDEVGVMGIQNEPANNRVRLSLVSETGGSARVEVYVYGASLSPPAGGWGLQVLSGSGSLVFDSRFPTLSIDRFLSIPFTLSLSGSQNYSPKGCEASGLAKGGNGEEYGYVEVNTHFASWDGNYLRTYEKLVYYVRNKTDIGGAPPPTFLYYDYTITQGGIDANTTTLNNQRLGA